MDAERSCPNRKRRCSFSDVASEVKVFHVVKRKIKKANNFVIVYLKYTGMPPLT